jgi:NAD(P)-dependent dehydrogenase (short-subunit alcohol dehydrogenase family)
MVAAAVADYGRLDFAVNNAAMLIDTGLMADCSDEAFDRMALT